MNAIYYTQKRSLSSIFYVLNAREHLHIHFRSLRFRSLNTLLFSFLVHPLFQTSRMQIVYHCYSLFDQFSYHVDTKEVREFSRDGSPHITPQRMQFIKKICIYCIFGNNYLWNRTFLCLKEGRYSDRNDSHRGGDNIRLPKFSETSEVLEPNP